MQINSNIFTIVGGGFGLYGYLPALFGVFGGGVILPEKYRKTINSRVELKQFDDQILWVPSIEIALKKSSGVIIAIPPRFQFELVQNILNLDNIQRLIIEKPVAPTVDSAIQLFDNAMLKSKKIRVGYTFIYSDWYDLLKKLTEHSSHKIEIVWTFKADHIIKHKETWKRYHSRGGGVLRFYGIHLIAVLASLGYKTVGNSYLEEIANDQPIHWEAIFREDNMPQCKISISINSDNNEFSINRIDEKNHQRSFYFATNPFLDTKYIGNQDIRVPVLERLIRTLELDDFNYISIYQKTNSLWNKVELANNLHC